MLCPDEEESWVLSFLSRKHARDKAKDEEECDSMEQNSVDVDCKWKFILMVELVSPLHLEGANLLGERVRMGNTY